MYSEKKFIENVIDQEVRGPWLEFCLPDRFNSHKQRNDPNSLTQVESPLQGLSKHSSLSLPHVSPSSPSGHAHVKVPRKFSHVPIPQGDSAHSSMSSSQMSP